MLANPPSWPLLRLWICQLTTFSITSHLVGACPASKPYYGSLSLVICLSSPSPLLLTRPSCCAPVSRQPFRAGNKLRHLIASAHLVIKTGFMLGQRRERFKRKRSKCKRERERGERERESKRELRRRMPGQSECQLNRFFFHSLLSCSRQLCLSSHSEFKSKFYSNAP